MKDFDENKQSERALKSVRQKRIQRLVDQNGQVTVTEASTLFGISEATARRDLEELAEEGWVRRTYGGAVRLERAAREDPVAQRMGKQSDEKERIGKLAASLVQAGETIFLGGGSTVHAVARHLHDVPNLTVITNALNVINELADEENIKIIVVGGLLSWRHRTMVGLSAERAIHDFRVHRAILGAGAIDVRHGITSDYDPEITFEQSVFEISPQIVIVADHSKFGKVSTLHMAPVTVAAIIVTDSGTPPEIIAELQQLGIEVNAA